MNTAQGDWESERSALKQLAAAAVDGDMDTIARLMPRVRFEACSLKAMKRCLGADFIRTANLDTTKADQEYGPNWLEED